MQTSPDRREAAEAPLDAAQEPIAQEAEEPKSIKDCPQTPGNRIPLADLISNAEDAFNPAPGPEVTPVDHVIWQHIPASSNPDTSSQTPGGRRKKRRHSSSSAGSPSHPNSKKGQKEPLDLQSIQALFKTPQHDIAAELWNNYMDKNMVESSEELPPPRLANLLSSSPQTPGSGRTSRDSSGGMRRSISCAAEWPTSRAKRRRVNRQAPESGRSIFSRANSNVLDSGNSGKGKSSRINFLIDKIEKSLHPTRPADAVPPNSSPLRKQVDAERCRSSSPTMDRKGPGNSGDQKASVRAPTREAAGVAQLPVLRESSSEFGDDDLDQDLMDLADAAAEDPFVAAPASHNEFESLGSSAWSKLAAEKPQSSFTKQPPVADVKPHNVSKVMDAETNVEASDEFDDDYGDYAENFDEILAGCDKKQPVPEQEVVGMKPAAAPLPVAAPSTMLNEKKENAEATFSEDEFDDDFDLDAIEQTMKHTGAEETYVGRS